MASKHQKIILALFLLLCVHAADEIESLTAGIVYKVSLPPQKHKQFSFKIQNDSPAGENFYITAESPFNDPYEQPIMTITSGNYTQSCYEEANDYTGICFIENKDLKKDREFILDLYCIVDCNLLVGGYFNEVFLADLGETVVINSLEDFGLAVILEVDLPLDLVFDQIEIVAFIENYDDIKQGLQMYLTYGDNSTEINMPTSDHYLRKGDSVFGHAVGVFLSKSEINAGDRLFVYLFSGANMTVSFTTRSSDNGQVQIEVGYPFVDYTSYGEERIYVLNLTEQLEENVDNSTELELQDQYDLTIKIITYSGTPQIKVSFDPEFPNSKSVDNFFIETTMSYLITPQMRKELGFTGMVYVKISSFWSTNYLVSAMINRKNFIAMQNQVTELARLPEGKLQNFIYEDEESSERMVDGKLIVEYKLVAKIIGGTASIGIRPCHSLNQNNSLDCLMKSPEDMKDPKVDQSFQEINPTIDQYWNTFEVVFNYDVAKCPSYTRSGRLYYLCYFHIVVINFPPEKQNPEEPHDLTIGLQMKKDTVLENLQEGRISRGTISRDEYNFYTFELTSLQDVESIQFFTTTIQGDIALIMSTTDKYPTIRTPNTDMSVMGSIQINKYDDAALLKKGTYYLSVFGYEVSDYTISVAISRKRSTNDTSGKPQENTSVTVLSLQKGFTETFTIPEGLSKLYFSFTPSEQNQLSVLTLMEISNQISFSISDKTNLKQPICQKSTDSPSKKCSFLSTFGSTYIIEVVGNSNQQQIFTILYSTEDNCEMYPINFPLYVSLEPSKHSCFLYTLSALQDLEIAVSLSPIQIIEKSIAITIKINQEHELSVNGYDRIITKQELSDFCDPETTPRCRIELTFTNKDTKYGNSFMAAVQTVDGDSVLFDGNVHKVVTDHLTSQEGKKFFFYTFESSPMKIFLTSQTQSSYRIAARVVKNKDYVSDLNDTLYPSYTSTNDANVVLRDSSINSLTTVLIIDSSKFKNVKLDKDDLYVVLISIFSNDKKQESGEIYAFKIEATQYLSSLPFGESKVDFLSKDQVMEYRILVSSSSHQDSSVLTVRSMGEDTCFSVYLEELELEDLSNDDMEPTLVPITNIYTFNNQTGDRTVVVKGLSDSCTYQITYNTVSSPVITITTGVPNSVKLSKQNEIKYFLYQHGSEQSLRIIQMTNAGSSNLYVTPLDGKLTMEDQVRKNVKQYKYTTDEKNSNLIIPATSPDFCKHCYYLIAVEASPSVDLELIAGPADMPIPLKQGSVLKDKLIKGPISLMYNTYQFYSITNFQLTVDKIYGDILVSIVDPHGNRLFDKFKMAKDHEQLHIEVPEYLANQTIDFYDQKSRFEVIIEPAKAAAAGKEEECKYYISVKKGQKVQKIFQGLPLSTILMESKPYEVQFLNLNEGGKIHVLLEILNLTSSEDNEPAIKFTTKINEEGKKESKDIPNSVTVSESSFNIEIAAKRGNYTLVMESPVTIKVSLILVKKSFSHLKVGSSYLITDPETVFEIYSPGKSVMIEIFACEGEVSVSSSRNYSLLDENNNTDSQGIVKMEHANYGGHYVISAENLQGEYFIKVNQLTFGEKGLPLKYQIGYHLYSPSTGQKMPYKVYSISDLTIKYMYHLATTQFTLSHVQRKDHQAIVATITYKLYISASRDPIDKMTKCSEGQIYTQKIVKQYSKGNLNQQQEQIHFTINVISPITQNSEISKIIGQNVTSYFIGGQAVVQLADKDENHAREAYFVYDVSQLLKNNQPVYKEKSNIGFVVLWIVLPFLAGSILLYFAARYLIRSFSAYPTQLIEQDVQEASGPTEEVFKNNPDVESGHKG